MVLLTASSGLGTYIPGVQLYHYLAGRGYTASLEVLERLYREDKLRQLMRARLRFQQDFRFALLARKSLNLHRAPENLCPEKKAALMAKWQEARESHFIVFSGFWLPLLRSFRELTGKEMEVECVQMETVFSPSWCAHLLDYPYPKKIVWFFTAEGRGLVQKLIPSDDKAVMNRKRRLVLHGGGWQIGDYGSCLESLTHAGYQLLVAQPHAGPFQPKQNVRYFCLDSSWETWRAEEGEYAPVQIQSDDRFVPVTSSNDHWLLSQIRQSLGVISKAGGATLLDSLASATPLVFASPYGVTEAQNADLWRMLGFGVSLDEWRSTGYDEELLHTLQLRLCVARDQLTSYGETIHATQN